MAGETKTHRRLDDEADALGLWSKPRAEVREQLVTHYMPFADTLAGLKVERNPRLDIDDVRQEAYIALLKAVDKFDPANEQGAAFTSYAGWIVRGACEEPSRAADWMNHKHRAADRELRARLQAGDPDARACDLLPEMNSTAFSSNPRPGDEGVSLEPTDREASSGIEAAETQVAKLMDAVDPTVARYLREGLDTRRQHRGSDAGPDFEALAIRWSTSVEGAAAVFRACVDSLQDLRTAA